MKRYDTVIIGSGYLPLGYAITRANTLIIEERELCDTHFCLPQRTFRYSGGEPESEIGREALEAFISLGLLDGRKINAGALESGFCELVIRHGVEILLRCRVIGREMTESGTHLIRLIGGGGIETVEANRVIDTRSAVGDKYITALFTARSAEDAAEIGASFSEGEIEPAFYQGRYAIHLPIRELTSPIDAMARIQSKWPRDGRCTLILVAPIFYTVASECTCASDAAFSDPFSAIDAGVRLAKEV